MYRREKAVRPVVIVIAGGSGSGKTTVVRSLIHLLGEENCVLLALDDYYKDLSDLAPERREAINFDHPDQIDFALLARHLGLILEGQRVEVPVYDFSAHTRRSFGRTLAPTRYLLLEGILALHSDATSRLADLTVYLDTPPDLRFIRRLRRDLQERGRSLDSVISQYLETVRAMHLQFVEPSAVKAELRLNGEHSPEENARLVLQAILRLSRQG